MNRNLVFLLIFFSIGTLMILSLPNHSFAQSSPSQIQFLSENNTFIFVQTFVHNSNGQLVTYLGSDKFSSINRVALNNLLDFESTENDPVITINGKKFQVIRRQVTIPYERENVIASTVIAHSTNGTLSMVARFAHDGYPLIPGDKVTTVWTFIRP